MPGPVWLWCAVGALAFTLMIFAAVFGTPTREVSELDGFPKGET